MLGGMHLAQGHADANLIRDAGKAFSTGQSVIDA
jgi:hypothetical protein